MGVDKQLAQAVVFGATALLAAGYALTMGTGIERVAVLLGAAIMLGVAVKGALDVLVRRRDR